MGERHKVVNEEDEKKWKELIQYYRIYCIRTYKDNPKNWQTQKDERKKIKKRNYTSREKREREQYYTKLSRSMKRKENEFDRISRNVTIKVGKKEKENNIIPYIS